MLVLSRRPQEQLHFPQLDIRITVVSIGSNRVKLGIDAPRHIDIARSDATPPPGRPRPLFDDSKTARSEKSIGHEEIQCVG